MIKKVINRFLCSNFYTAKNATMTYTDTLNLGADGRLQESSETTQIHDWNDKYNLAEVRNPYALLTHLRQVDYDYKLNDLVYFMRHLVHISEQHGGRQGIIQHNDFKGLLSHLKRVLKQGEHEKYPLIGSYAYCLQQLDVNDHELWKLLEQKVLDDEYYTNFKESVYAVQGFTKLPLIYYGYDPQKVQLKLDKLYKKIERIVRLTIWEVDMKYYQKISTSLAKVNRFDTETFNKLEQHILTNLSLDYHTNQMVDILLSFAKGQQGSKNFYDAIQHVIFKGHMFNRNYFLQSQVELRYDGHLVAQLLDVYNEARNRDTFDLHPDFQAYVSNLASNKKTKYDLQSATKTLSLLKTMKLDELEDALLQRISTLEGPFLTEDIIEFYKWIETQDQLPRACMLHLEASICNQADQMPVDNLIILLQYLCERPKFILKPTLFSQSILAAFESQMNQLSSFQLQSFSQLFQRHLVQLGQEESKELVPATQMMSRIRDIELLQKFKL